MSRQCLQGVTARYATSHANMNTTPQQTTTNIKHHLQTKQAKQDDLLIGQHRMPMSTRHEACAWNDCVIGRGPSFHVIVNSTLQQSHWRYKLWRSCKENLQGTSGPTRHPAFLRLLRHSSHANTQQLHKKISRASSRHPNAGGQAQKREVIKG